MASSNSSEVTPTGLSETEILLYLLECLLNTFAILVSILFLHVMWKTKLFLRNQKWYLSNIMVANLLTIAARYPLLIQILAETKIFPLWLDGFLNKAHDLADSIIFNMLCQIIIFIDCFWTTVNVNGEMPLINVILLCILQWAAAEGQIFLGAYNIPPPAYSMCLLEFMNFVCWLTFVGLILIGRFRYKYHTTGDLKEKFKISTTLRTLSVLKVMAICSALRNFICINVLLSLFIWIRPNKDVDAERFVSFFYDLTLSFYAAFVPFIMIPCHEEMNIFAFTMPPSNAITKVSMTEDNHGFFTKNVVGEVLRPTMINEHDHHFSQLRAGWNNRRPSIHHTNTAQPHIINLN